MHGVEVKVKICGLTNLDDARAAARLGADFLGFVFAPSARQLTLETAERFWHDLPPYVPRVGVFKDQTAREIGRFIDRLPLGYLQFHGREGPSVCRSFGLPVIRAVSAREPRDLRPLELYRDVADYFLIDLPKEEGEGKVLPLEVARAAIGLPRPVFLAGGLTAENVGPLLREVRPFAVDVARGVESSPGKKDREKIERFIGQVRQASGTIGGGVSR